MLEGKSNVTLINHANHWLYKIIPADRSLLKLSEPWKWIPWALFGNDDDGIFGEAPTSGKEWLARWGGGVDKTSGTSSPGAISFKRFVAWQMRNPLHNFTFYVIGIAWMKRIPLIQLLLVTPTRISFVKVLKTATVFPMDNESGLYKAIHGLPFISFRLNLSTTKRLEGYFGWRPRGNFGIALRVSAIAQEAIAES